MSRAGGDVAHTYHRRRASLLPNDTHIMECDDLHSTVPVRSNGVATRICGTADLPSASSNATRAACRDSETTASHPAADHSDRHGELFYRSSVESGDSIAAF